MTVRIAMPELNERINLVVSAEDRRHLKALALSNTNGNDSEMIRELIRRAVENPKALGLNAPFYVENWQPR